MPTYDYVCEANGQQLEVRHGMNEKLMTWGELCERLGMEPGDTPSESPIRRLISGGAVINSSALSNPEPACASGGCCSSGVCGLDR